MSNETTTKTKRKRKHIGRPYKLTYDQHVNLIKRKVAGEDVLTLAQMFGLKRANTVYAYINLDPESRTDAPKAKSRKKAS